MADAVLRYLNQNDFEQSVNLASYSFQFSLSQADIESRREKFLNETEHRYGVFQDKELCAQASLLHMQAFIGGKLMKMGGLAGVCTAPEYRRNGYVATIIETVLQDMRDNGEVISMLHPFSFGFYRKYGWETYIEYKRYEMNAEHLSSILKKERNNQRKGKVERIKGYEELLPVYDAYAVQFNGMLVRDMNWWNNRIAFRKPGHIARYMSNEGKAEGYIIYEIANSVMNIHEIVAVTPDAEKELWHFIAQHDSMLNVVKWTAPRDDAFTYSLDNPRIKQEIVPYFMARIVDIENFLKQYQFKPASTSDAFILAVDDDGAPWNNGYYQLHINEAGDADIKKLNSNELIDSDISIDIGALTAVMLNYQNLVKNYHIGRATGNHSAINRFQNRLSAESSYLTDFF